MQKSIPILSFLLLLSIAAMSQVDSLSATQETVQDTVPTKSSKEKDHKRVSDFKIYGGVSAGTILLSESPFESAYGTGFLLGAAYRKGRFGYWEIGLNYNNTAISLKEENILDDNLQIRQLELPLLGGINLLSLTRRVVGVRLFGGAVPGYILGISNNPFFIDEDDFERFQIAGRAGVGVDVLFMFVELGYQYGFIDLLKNQDSNLSQFDFRLGVRF